MKKCIREIVNGETFDSVFIVDSITEKSTKKMTPWWLLVLKDKDGLVNAKVWDADAFTEGPPTTGEFIKVRAEAGLYKGKLDLTLRKVRRLDPTRDGAEFTYDDFVPVGPHDRFKLIEEMHQTFKQLHHPGLRAVCMHVFEDAQLHSDLRDAPAAASIHQPYIGGLLEHVSHLCGLVCQITEFYNLDTPESFDLLLTACLLHDIGKTRELHWKTSIGYTDEGSLIGHVAISMEMVDRLRLKYWEGIEVARGVPDGELPDWGLEYKHHAETWLHLRHIIASHHGQLEWHAIQEPVSREANLFHLIDNIDSKMGMFDQLEKTETFDAEGFTSRIHRLNGRAWKQPL